MTCQELIDFLMDYVDGSLPDEERQRFDDHLAICPDCVNYLVSYRTTMSLGRMAFADPNVPVPPAVPTELVQAILAARRHDD
jgi:anti-sigma factor RsiW